MFMAKKNDKKTISRILWENAAWVLGIGFAIINLYVASVLSPIKSDIKALAEQTDRNAMSIEELSDIQHVVIANSTNIKDIQNNVEHIRAILER